MFRKGGCSHIRVPSLEAEIIELAYGFDQKFSMVILLPNKNVPLVKVIDNLRILGLHTVIENLNESEEDPELEIYLPRFSISSDLKLNYILQRMGLFDLFDSKHANLSKISKHPTFVSQFVQKAVIDVDEKGTVAAAVTASLSFQSIPSQFYVNRPFAFMIVERTTNTILFCGHVRNPTNVWVWMNNENLINKENRNFGKEFFFFETKWNMKVIWTLEKTENLCDKIWLVFKMK